VKILALDTATENCSAALWSDGALGTREELLERGAAQRILSMIDELLGESGVSLKALDAIAFGCGPGGFTGVRLAASVTQGLAFGADLPVVPVSDLRALAQRVLGRQPQTTRVLVCADARMNEVYWGCFERSGKAMAEAVGAEHVGGPATVDLPASWLTTEPPAWGAGSGFAAYPQLTAALATRLGGFCDLLPRAAEIAQLAVPEIVAGRVLLPEQALPVYLRNDVARRLTVS
jgi:tRNA threonylcarbamoyladenosine biosynthesis protein TsaB